MSFSNQINRIAKKINADIEDVALVSKLELLNQISEGTRVDTGRARGNWQTTSDSPAEGTLNRLDPTGEKVKAEALAKTEPIGVTYYTNNLPYIKKLEEMDGMVISAVANINRNIRNAARG